MYIHCTEQYIFFVLALFKVGWFSVNLLVLLPATLFFWTPEAE
jgi:hypothetical protein